jgi:uncharacterized OB-fold protein
MTIEIRAGEWTKPLPAPDVISAEYWSALSSGRLLVQHCPDCGHYQFYPRALCTSCGSEPVFREVSGRGTVYTFTVIRQNGVPAFQSDVPYVVAMIQLEEGVRLMGNVTGCPVEEVRVGMEVRPYAVPAEPGIGILQWEPAGN